MIGAIDLRLETERLILRDFEESDWQAIHSYASDPEVVRFAQWGPNSETDTKNFIQRTISSQQEEPRQAFELAVILKSDNRLIGSCGLYLSSEQNREGFIGYCFHRDFWGRGYATEAAKAILGFGFQQLGLHRIFATCDPENLRSARVLEKIGMQREGYLREDKYVKGKWRDSLLYAILDRELTSK